MEGEEWPNVKNFMYIEVPTRYRLGSNWEKSHTIQVRWARPIYFNEYREKQQLMLVKWENICKKTDIFPG